MPIVLYGSCSRCSCRGRGPHGHLGACLAAHRKRSTGLGEWLGCQLACAITSARPVVPRPCSTFSRQSNPARSSSSARRRRTWNSNSYPLNAQRMSSLLPSGPRSTEQKRVWTKEQNMNMVGGRKREGRANENEREVKNHIQHDAGVPRCQRPKGSPRFRRPLG